MLAKLIDYLCDDEVAVLAEELKKYYARHPSKDTDWDYVSKVINTDPNELTNQETKLIKVLK